MKKSQKATSIVEAMVVMLIIVSGVTGMYRIYDESTSLSDSTANKIQAIQIASQGIEAMINIRDTNWILFSSDFTNCWNVYNYNANCIGDDGGVTDPDGDNTTYDIKDNSKSIIYKDPDNKWILENKTVLGLYDITNIDYANEFLIGKKNGIYTQSGITEDLKPRFTREIVIDYLQNDGITAGNETDQKIKITSKVQWKDKNSTLPHIIELEQILSNWKK